MSIKREINRHEVEVLVEASQRVLALYGLLCDHRHDTLRESDSDCLNQEGVGFIGSFYEPKRALEKAIANLRD